jgi:SNF2 family DNA or RNA helicase
MPQSLIPMWDGFQYFKHQKKAIRWMLDIEKHGVSYKDDIIKGGILADDMGLGKTLEIGGLIMNNPVKQTLIICPLSLIDNWHTNMSKAGFNVFILEDCWRLYDKTEKDTDVPSIYITNYDKLTSKTKSHFIQSRKWNRIVMDEAHKIRNPNTNIAWSVYNLRSEYRWAVTGTPIVNSNRDAASLLYWIGLSMPINHNTGNPIIKWKSEYYSLLNTLVLRRTMDEIREVMDDAPPKPLIQDIIIPFTTEEEGEFYRGIQGHLMELIEKYKDDNGMEFLELLLRLRQISVHPQVYINGRRRVLGKFYTRRDWSGSVSKFEEMKAIIEDDNKSLTPRNKHKYIFICHFKDEIDLIREYLLKNKLFSSVFVYSGELSKSKRDAVIYEAKDTPDCAICIQLQAGGVGLNLQEFDRVMFLSPWWNSAIMEQAIARAVRVGQKKEVNVYHIRLEEEITFNIDNFMHDKVEIKQELATEFFDAVCTSLLDK